MIKTSFIFISTILFFFFHHNSISSSSCFNIAYNDLSVCQSHGSCINFNECICENGFYGFNCQQRNISSEKKKIGEIIYYTTSNVGNWNTLKEECLENGGVIAIPVNNSNENMIKNEFLNEIQLVFGIHYNRFSRDLTTSTSSVYNGEYSNWKYDYSVMNYDFMMTIAFSEKVNSEWTYTYEDDEENKALCALYKCNGTLGNESEVCNTHGRCINHNECECVLGYGNEYCKDQVGQTTEWNFQNAQIFVTPNATSFENAQVQCVASNGSLYIPENLDEQIAIAKMLANDGYSKLWIGLQINNTNHVNKYPSLVQFDIFSSFASGFPFRSGIRGIAKNVYQISNDGLTPNPLWTDEPNVVSLKGLCIS